MPPLLMWPSDGFDGYFALKAYAVIALALGLGVWWVVTVLRGGRLQLQLGLVGWLGFALALWLTLSTLLSDSPATGVWGYPGRDDGLLVWLSGLLVMASGSITREWSERRVVFGAVMGAGCLLALYGVAQHFGLDASGLAILGRTGRVFSSFRNPIFFGGYLTLITPLLLCATTYGRPWRRVAASLALAVALAALYFTFTRAAWLGTTGGMVLFLLLVRRAGGSRWVGRALAGLGAAVLVAGVVATIPVSAAPPEEHDALSDLSTLSSANNPRNDGRLAIWEISLRIIADHPMVGVGLDQMGSVFESYRTERFDAAEGPEVGADRAHSDPLHLAVVAGIPAVMLFCAMVLVVLVRAVVGCFWRRRGVPQPLWYCATVAGVCGYLAQSLVSITVPGVHSLFLLLLGFLVAWGARWPLPATLTQRNC